MALIADIVVAITAQPAPVVFLDTCVLLDVVRAPLRNTAGEVRVAQRLLDSVRKVPNTAYLVVGSPTSTEWADHIDEVERNCKAAVATAHAVAEICSWLPISGVVPPPASINTLPGQLRSLSAGLLAAAIPLDHDANALSRAINRVIKSQLPANKGGKGAKDAVILEHALELTRQLRLAGYAQPCVFTSSNKADFANAADKLHPDLVPDFDPINLHYAVSLAACETYLLAEGWVP